ncbi:MAG: hypothetical protein OHK0022_49190 [Roseiflexaceae bacterium]
MTTTSPDLFALVLRLSAATAGELPARFGHQVQALFLDLVAQVDPALAERLHAAAPAKPYTVATLAPVAPPDGGRARLRAGAPIVLRVTLLDAALFQPLTRALLAQGSRPALRLGSLALTLAEACCTPGSHPWAGFGSFDELRAQAHPAGGIDWHFAAPAAFSNGEDAGLRRVGLFPDPSAVFGSLLRRWNALAPMPLDPALVERAAAQAVVSGYDLRSTVFHLGQATQVGFVGRCRYELRGEPVGRAALALLAGAAFYLGVGMKTARGMGLCRANLTQRSAARRVVTPLPAEVEP